MLSPPTLGWKYPWVTSVSSLLRPSLTLPFPLKYAYITATMLGVKKMPTPIAVLVAEHVVVLLWCLADLASLWLLKALGLAFLRYSCALSLKGFASACSAAGV